MLLVFTAAAAPPVRFSFGFLGGVEAEVGEAPAASIPLPLPIAPRMVWADGWGLDYDASTRWGPTFDMTIRANVLWTPLPTATWVPYVHAGAVFGNRDVPFREEGGRLGVGPTLGAGLEVWPLPRVALDFLVDGDLTWSTELDSPGWQFGGDVSVRVGVRFCPPASSLLKNPDRAR